jgi:hypothetical protein
MDIILTIMANPNTGSTYKGGDIIGASPNHTSKCRHQTLAMVRVLGVPEVIPPVPLLKRIKQTLENSIQNNQGMSNKKTLRRRRWFLDLANAPQAVKIALRDDREYTATWTQVKPYIKRRIVVDDNDESRDTFAVITDDDL